MSLPSAATSQRESFGDRKIPDITRKITACVACRRQKIKCHMNGSNPPCSRCKTRGLPCTVNRSLQTLLESDADWKEEVEQRLRKIEHALENDAITQANFPSPTPRSQHTTPKNTEGSMPEHPSSSKQPETVSEVSLNLSCHLGSFPGSSVASLNFTDHKVPSDHTPDLIASGLISVEEAEEYFTIYHESMEPCLHRIIPEDDCLANIRARSSFLTAALCVVGSFGISSAKHQLCYAFFIKEVSSKVFSTRYSFDDVRALCIGAFWLNKVASILIGLAVRISAELNLHRCITKMPHTKRECYERTRLYFLVYICDHQCSLIYGRPPMTREFQSLKSPKVFLQSTLCIPDDAKLISQVELWSISSRVFDLFGADTETSIDLQRAAELNSLSYSFEQCRLDLLAPNATQNTLSDYSREVFELYVHCAKLSLYSHTFRRSSQRSENSTATSSGLEKFERCAIDSALSVVRSVTWGGEIQAHFEMLPSYFGTLIAFAFILFVKAASQERMSLFLDKSDVFRTLKRLVEVFSASSGRVQPKHPLHSVTKSLEIAMKRLSNFDMLDDEHMTVAQDEHLFAFDTIGTDPFRMDDLEAHDSLFHTPIDGFYGNSWVIPNP